MIDMSELSIVSFFISSNMPLWNLKVYIMFYFVLTNPVGIFIQGKIQTFFLAGGEMCFHIEKGRVEIIKDKNTFSSKRGQSSSNKNDRETNKKGTQKGIPKNSPPPRKSRRGGVLGGGEGGGAR